MKEFRSELYVNWKSGEGKKFFYNILSKLGLKPTELARKLDIPRSTFWSWLLERNNSPLETVKCLCELASTDFNSLTNSIENFSRLHRFEKGNIQGFKKYDERTKTLARKGFQKLLEFLERNPEIRRQSSIKGLEKLFSGKYFIKNIETSDGTKVRSTQEKAIYEKYLSLGIRPVYEKDFIKLDGMVMIPDFYINEKTLYHEHLGVIKNSDYIKRKIIKIKKLAKRFQNFSILITVDKNNFNSLNEEFQRVDNVKIMEFKQFLECAGVELSS